MIDASKARGKTRAELVDEIKRLVVDSVNIQHVPLSDIHAETTLFANGLGLDSVDVLEIVVAVEKRYGIRVRDAQVGQKIFQSIGSIADFVLNEGAKTSAPSASAPGPSPTA
jgi:acyl carrier protein